MSGPAPIIVFDLDGTLADTAPDLIGTLNLLLARAGLELQSPQAARALVGAGARALIERGFATSGASYSREHINSLVSEFLKLYEERIADESTLFPGAEASLDRFARAGFRLAVCTNKPEGLARLLLERLGVADRFAAICGRETFPMSKPDGRTLLATIGMASGDPSRALMVGNSKTDVETARNAKVPIVAVDFGYSDPPVAACGPDRLISHFDQLWEAATSLLPS